MRRVVGEKRLFDVELNLGRRGPTRTRSFEHRFQVISKSHPGRSRVVADESGARVPPRVLCDTAVSTFEGHSRVTPRTVNVIPSISMKLFPRSGRLTAAFCYLVGDGGGRGGGGGGVVSWGCVWGWDTASGRRGRSAARRCGVTVWDHRYIEASPRTIVHSTDDARILGDEGGSADERTERPRTFEIIMCPSKHCTAECD